MTTLLAGLIAAPAIALVPMPTKMVAGAGEFHITRDTVIVASPGAEGSVARLREYLAPATGFRFPASRSTRGNSIRINLMPNAGFPREGYRLRVDSSGVDIRAGDAAGLFYGVQTLRQLLPADVYAATRRDVAWKVPYVQIEDEPRFGWRGLMLDVSRHFMPKADVKRFIDLLAAHKMNTFHWHLTDDQGWRIEIKKYPKLTTVGGFRKETMLGHYRDQKWDGQPHGGFYTQDDIREIVKYAADRHIQIIPEIEMPGHAQAAIAAYPELGNKAEHLEVWTRWGVNENVFNVEDSTISFLQDVLLEVMDLFPSEFIHIGGDECPKTQWKTSARAQELMRQRGLHDEEQLQSWFIRQMDKFLADRGRRLIGWDEILEGGLAPGAAVMSWRGEAGGIAAAKAGHDVVMSPNSYAYLDYYQARPTSTEPLAIGGYLPLETVYSYNPIPASLTADQAKRILGVQGNIWTEYIPNFKKVEYMAFPRALALAEVGWSPQSARSYDDFLQRLPSHLARLDRMNVNYRRLSPPVESVGGWRANEMTTTFSVKEWDVTQWAKQPGSYQATFAFSGGAHRLDIEWAELVVDGVSAGRDAHAGTTGGADRDNTYRLKLPRAGGKVVLRASVRTDGGTDSRGQIFLQRIGD